MRRLWILLLTFAAAMAGGAVSIVQDTCGPFTDVTPAFCPYVLELYYLGITVGTSATTFSPDNPLTRGQAAVFVSKGLNQSLARSSRRAALGQWWTTTPQYSNGLGVTAVGSLPLGVASDGTDLWVASYGSNSVLRLSASDGRLLETWTGAFAAARVIVAIGRVLVLGQTNAGAIYMIDPTQPAGNVTTVADNVGQGLASIAFDGSRFWVAAETPPVSIVTPSPSPPWSVQHVTTGFVALAGILYDGTSIWVTDVATGSLLKLDSAGAVIQVVSVGASPWFPVFDGTNIWVPNHGDASVSVVRASTGAVVGTLTGNGLSSPAAGAFDGQRILVTDEETGASGVSLWKAADLTALGSLSTGASTNPFSVCSDGVNFWVALSSSGQLARF